MRLFRIIARSRHVTKLPNPDQRLQIAVDDIIDSDKRLQLLKNSERVYRHLNLQLIKSITVDVSASDRHNLHNMLRLHAQVHFASDDAFCSDLTQSVLRALGDDSLNLRFAHQLASCLDSCTLPRLLQPDHLSAHFFDKHSTQSAHRFFANFHFRIKIDRIAVRYIFNEASERIY